LICSQNVAYFSTLKSIKSKDQGMRLFERSS
jgi:hypothetical protein